MQERLFVVDRDDSRLCCAVSAGCVFRKTGLSLFFSLSCVAKGLGTAGLEIRLADKKLGKRLLLFVQRYEHSFVTRPFRFGQTLS